MSVKSERLSSLTGGPTSNTLYGSSAQQRFIQSTIEHIAEQKRLAALVNPLIAESNQNTNTATAILRQINVGGSGGGGNSRMGSRSSAPLGGAIPVVSGSSSGSSPFSLSRVAAESEALLRLTQLDKELVDDHARATRARQNVEARRFSELANEEIRFDTALSETVEANATANRTAEQVEATILAVLGALPNDARSEVAKSTFDALFAGLKEQADAAIAVDNIVHDRNVAMINQKHDLERLPHSLDESRAIDKRALLLRFGENLSRSATSSSSSSSLQTALSVVDTARLNMQRLYDTLEGALANQDMLYNDIRDKEEAKYSSEATAVRREYDASLQAAEDQLALARQHVSDLHKATLALVSGPFREPNQSATYPAQREGQSLQFQPTPVYPLETATVGVSSALLQPPLLGRGASSDAYPERRTSSDASPQLQKQEETAPSGEAKTPLPNTNEIHASLPLPPLPPLPTTQPATSSSFSSFPFPSPSVSSYSSSFSSTAAIQAPAILPISVPVRTYSSPPLETALPASPLPSLYTPQQQQQQQQPLSICVYTVEPQSRHDIPYPLDVYTRATTSLSNMRQKNTLREQQYQQVRPTLAKLQSQARETARLRLARLF